MNWTDVSDASVLDALEAKTWQSTIDPAAPDTKDAAINAGWQIYTGTVRVFDTAEVLKQQGISNPNPGSTLGEPYTLLIFDSPTDVDAKRSGGPGRRSDSAALIGLATEQKVWSIYDGKTVTVAVDPTAIWWPSDTSLPLGEPHVYAQSFVIVE